jgi:hypothetical protein
MGRRPLGSVTRWDPVTDDLLSAKKELTRPPAGDRQEVLMAELGFDPDDYGPLRRAA